MSLIAKSLSAIDDFIKNVSIEEKNRIWLEVKEMNIEGPTLEEYFSFVLDLNPIRFQFQEGIQEGICLKPPSELFKVTYHAPKFPLEHFFCNIAIWN